MQNKLEKGVLFYQTRSGFVGLVKPPKKGDFLGYSVDLKSGDRPLFVGGDPVASKLGRDRITYAFPVTDTVPSSQRGNPRAGR